LGVIVQRQETKKEEYVLVEKCKGNLMISTNRTILARENQRSIKNKIHKLITHLARESQREKSKVLPAEGVTIYSQLCDKVKGTGPHWEVNPLKQAH
jgi:hypothetical protein